MDNKTLKKEVFDLIAVDKTKEAIRLCLNYFSIDSDHYKDLTLLSSDLHDWNRRERRGLEPSPKDLIRIRLAVLQIIEEVNEIKPSENKFGDKPLDNKSHHRSIDDKVLFAIKKMAESRFPTDFEMQKYLIDENVEAYGKLQTFNCGDIPGKIFYMIKQKASEQFPNDFDMQLYIVNEQVKAYEAINSNKNY